MLAASRAAVPRWAHLRGCPGVSVLRPLSVSSDEDAPFLPLSHHRDRPLLQETETQVLPPGHGDTHKLILQTRGDLTFGDGAMSTDLPATPHPGWRRTLEIGCPWLREEGVVP